MSTKHLLISPLVAELDVLGPIISLVKASPILASKIVKCHRSTQSFCQSTPSQGAPLNTRVFAIFCNSSSPTDGV
jgi:hypothetical protein